MLTTGENKELHDYEVDLTEIDWNNLSPEEFQKVNERLLKNQKMIKQQERKKERSSGMVSVKLRGNIYMISQSSFNRLKAMKSEKSKNKLIDKIISENNIVESI